MRTVCMLAVVALVGVAAAQTVGRAVVPFGGLWDNVPVSAVAGQLRCFVYPAPYTITGATHLSGSLTVARAGSFVGLSIYPNSDSAAPLASIAVSSTTAGVITATVASFSLTAGTVYRWCACGAHNSIQIMGIQNGGGAGDLASQLMNAGGTRFGLATNTCTSGAAPSTTGTLSTIDIGAYVFGVDS